MIKTLLATSALLMLGVTAFAAPATPPHTTAKPAKAAPLICPVTGDTIASVKDAVGKSVYKGKTYYFCCPSCKPEFDKDPAKYVKKMSSTASTTAHPAHSM